MTVLFNRHISIDIGPEGEDGRRFEKMYMSFEVNKSNESDANKAKVAIYNLNSRSRELISQEGVIYLLRAGYSGFNEEPLIENLSSGNIEAIQTTKKGSDLLTELTLTEDGKKLRDKTIDKSFGLGISQKDIVNELVETLDVAKGAIKGIANKIFNSGASVSGKVKDKLDEIAKTNDLEWSIQNGEFQMLPKGSSTDEIAISLTNSTGLIMAKKVKFNEEDQINFKCLLNPKITIGRKVYIKNRQIDGFFSVQAVKQFGDNRSGPFFCEGVAK